MRPYLRSLFLYLQARVDEGLLLVSVCTNSFRAVHADPWLDELGRATDCSRLLQDRWCKDHIDAIMPKGHEFEGQKDLTAICSDIRLAVLIDNNPKAAMQKRNLLSVPSFCGNPYDLEMLRLIGEVDQLLKLKAAAEDNGTAFDVRGKLSFTATPDPEASAASPP